MCTVDIYKCSLIHNSAEPERVSREIQDLFEKLQREDMLKIDECYNQPTGQASAGTKTPAGKASDDIKNDALGNPSRFKRNESSVAHEDNDIKELRDKQLGSNGMQSNGFSSKVAECNHPAPRRGFNQK